MSLGTVGELLTQNVGSSEGMSIRGVGTGIRIVQRVKTSLHYNTVTQSN